MESAEQITQKAKSNLAIALRVLPKAKRQDMTVFYAFCRVVDDIADSKELSKEAKHEALAAWREGIDRGVFQDNELGSQLMEVAQRHEVPPHFLKAVVDGCELDIFPQRFSSWEQLQQYNWKVAGAVGLASSRIFGCVHEDSDRYAEILGDALQLTNILRDVGEDLENDNRIYLPENDMIRFQYSERDLVGRVYDGRFIAMMNYQAERAEHLFAEAEKISPTIDRKALLPARMMAAVYLKLLQKMKSDGFQVFEKRYRLTKFQKICILLKFLMVKCS